MIRDENYVVIKGWMITRLGLKGTELLLYGLIYGFSQDGVSEFNGSLAYLARFAGVTENSCRTHLQAMRDKGLIRIREHIGYTNSYSVILDKPNITVEKKERPKTEHKEVGEIIDYLNRKTGSNYRQSESTNKPIVARLNEGFTTDDLKRVIDNKCAEWLGTEMQIYLRPSTLFGNKFQAYLNQRVTKAESSYDLEAHTQRTIMKAPKYKRKIK